ncbi:hypothetical protein ACIHCQ_08755 [Streptomyces sp. NPDC052236]|uniref:hypothetical protein n=1 Tax=Streptomyces sp. NPDC052236 TaxID=3365686 RepID=UPI0037D1DB8E
MPRGSTASVIGLVAALASILCGAGVAQADEDSEAETDGSGPGRNVGLLVIDNSRADSWLEMDRMLNTLIDSKGTAGSDHDGGGGAIDVQTGDTSAPATAPGSTSAPEQGSSPSPLSWIGTIGHPPWQGENGDGE